MTSYLPIAVRAYTEDTNAKPKKHRKVSDTWRLPERVLLFDCETRIDAGQALTFGSYRYCRFDDGQLQLIEEGLFHGDDLPESDLTGRAVLERYAAEHGLPLLSRREFVERVVWRCSYQARAWVVGFNLPFDLSRLAVGFSEGRGRNAGGHSLILWDYEDGEGDRVENRFRPRVQIKSIDSKRAFISFAHRRDADRDDLIPDDSSDGQPQKGYCFRGHFLDLRTLAFALSNRPHSLASACDTFGVEQGKQQTEQHGLITHDYIAYNRQDVAATGGLLEKLIAEYRHHPIGLTPTKAYSPASIAKAYLRAMRIEPPLQQQPDFPRDVLGAAMVAYYGGRTECRIRLTEVPVVCVDFLAMYPTVNTLMGLWTYLTADRIETRDATDETRELLEQIRLDDCFQTDLWRQLFTLVQVEPDGELFPTRADYSENGQWQIGLNPLSSDTPLWYPLADVLAATLLTGSPPRIVRAIRLDALGLQRKLRPALLAGTVEIDPVRDDFFKTLIEQRRHTSHRADLDPTERERIRTFLKVLANSGCYGIFAELNRSDHGSRRPVTIYGLHDPFVQRLEGVETPGEYAFPPLAACVTAAARLMLALLERSIVDAGGGYAYCDTDSMAIIATRTGGPQPSLGIRALSWAQVDEIVDRFAALNPYDLELVPGSILEAEEWNLDPTTGKPRQLYCYAVSAKRYALYNADADGKPILRKFSEHGLGHLRNPIDPTGNVHQLAKQVWLQILDDRRSQGR